jgi:hypothetical protein
MADEPAPNTLTVVVALASGAAIVVTANAAVARNFEAFIRNLLVISS